MKFADYDVSAAAGAILAHSVKHHGGLFKKGRVLSDSDIKLLEESGVKRVFAAHLEEGDVPEDDAADQVARAIAGSGARPQAPFTGRANLHAATGGLFVVDSERLRTINRLHESLTVATLAPFTIVTEGQMIATVKVIPFAVPKSVFDGALGIAAGEPLLAVRPFQRKRAGLVITRLPQTKPSIIDKSREAMQARLEALGSVLGEVLIVPHGVEPVTRAIRDLKEAGHDLVLLFGASAIVDRGDVIPAALEASGGEIVHLGMPVDPGNLLMLGRLETTPVIGVPSCARSPKVNGFDWVLARTLAGLALGPHDIMDMGAGGLLMEISSRPTPRESKPVQPKSGFEIAAVVLAAGRSTRMGSNKLLKPVKGKPMIRGTVEAALQSQASPVIVVTGHDAAHIRDALRGLPVVFVSNPNYAEGLSTSLAAGVSQLPPKVDGALMVLGDMPLVPAQTLNRLIAAFDPEHGHSICVPVYQGERGNPILWGRQHFTEFEGLKGDRGAKVLLVVNSANVVEVPAGNEGVLTDFDTPESLSKIRRGAEGA
jgi:molybdenum cofactor cytidylyltransferase